MPTKIDMKYLPYVQCTVYTNHLFQPLLVNENAHARIITEPPLNKSVSKINKRSATLIPDPSELLQLWISYPEMSQYIGSKF